MSGRVPTSNADPVPAAPVAGDGQVVVDRVDLEVAMWQVSHAVSCAGRACDCYVGRLRAALAVSTEGVGKQVSEVIDNTLWFIPDSHIWHEDRDCPSLRNTFRMNATRAEVENGHPRCGKPKTEGCARCSDWGFDRVSKEESK